MFIKINENTAINSSRVGYIRRDVNGFLYVYVNDYELKVDHEREGAVFAALDVHGMNI